MAAVTGKKLEPVACPVCGNYSSKRLTQVEAHLVSVHSTTLQQEWDRANGGPILCKCGCGETTTWCGWKTGYASFRTGHSSNIYAAYDEETARAISQKRKEKLIGKTSWAKGLSKETDERIKNRGEATSAGRKRAFDEGNITIWSKGLSKETDQRIAKISEKQRKKYANGELVPWAKGLSKETDDKVAAMATKVSIAHRTQHIRERLDTLKRLNVEEIKNRIEDSGKLKLTSDLSDYVNDATPNIQVTCTTCNDVFYGSLRKLQYNRCFKCDPGGSAAQTALADFIEHELKAITRRNDRTVIFGNSRPAELDIYLPEHNLAIEYNGLYWHSEANKTNIYHDNKSIQCAASKIKLFHVFEDEWRDKQHIVKGMIANRMHMTPNKIGARECSIVNLSIEERRVFFNANHIDGDTNAKWAVGLKTKEGRLIAAMSLRQPFHKKHSRSLEIARTCSATDTTVQGGLSKLTAAARNWTKNKGYDSMISYIDTRFGSNGNSWQRAGWSKKDETSPRFWWTDFHSRFNRFKYRADKSKNMTEAQVAEEAQVVKIWGCKNLTFEIT